MKSIAKEGIKYIGVLVASILLGTILLIAVYSLPVEPMKANAQRSTEIYDYEGVYPQLMWGYKMSQLDNSTDATMLLNAIYPGGGSVISRAMNVYRTEYHDVTPVKSLTHLANDVKEETYNIGYSRYWHGYLVILKPLLLFFDVADIRMINMFLNFSLLGYVLYLLVKQQKTGYILPFFTAVMLLNPIAVSLSFQFSTIYYIMLFSVIYVLKKGKMERKAAMLFLFIVGILTAYIDFLTYPLVALYFPLVFILAGEDDWKEAVKTMIFCSAAWGFGYILMWCGKWTIGSILMQRNMWEDALSRAALYGSMDYGEEKLGSVQVILKNVFVLVKWPVVFAGLGILIYYIRQFAKVFVKKTEGKADKGKNVKSFLAGLCPFTLVALVPFAWYVAAGSHSYIHYWYTYRELCVSVFAILAGFAKMLSLRGEE